MKTIVMVPFMAVAAAALASVGKANSDVFTESAIFERLSHFHDVGIPATTKDALNKATIADGACRILEPEFGGYTFYHNETATEIVISAMKLLPSTSGPSHFVLAAHKSLGVACKIHPSRSSPSPRDGLAFTLTARLTGMANWHRALCAGENDPAWNGGYDPAYMPQQIALTTGFMCMVGCDSANQALYSTNMQRLADRNMVMREELCSALPYTGAQRWTNITESSLTELSAAFLPLCGCGSS